MGEQKYADDLIALGSCFQESFAHFLACGWLLKCLLIFPGFDRISFGPGNRKSYHHTAPDLAFVLNNSFDQRPKYWGYEPLCKLLAQPHKTYAPPQSC